MTNIFVPYMHKINFQIFSGKEAPAEDEPKFNPFTGAGRRLDGKPLKYESSPASSSGSRDKQPDTSTGRGQQPSSGSSVQSSSRQSQGKLVFGSNANKSNGTQKVLKFSKNLLGLSIVSCILTIEQLKFLIFFYRKL